MALRRFVRAFRGEEEVTAQLTVGKLWDRLLGEFLGRWTELNRQDLPPAEIEAEMESFLDDLSEKPIQDLARTSSTVAYNEGRKAELLTALDTGKATFVVRSEVLDTNTCRPCEALDGAVFEIGTPEFREYQPPAKCDGRDRCRGFYVPIAEGAV